ncbi:MAG TPA: STAS domain-containing protein [Solirubrobacteraceae bacterium]|jgi:anti-anti-sigma factor|nr:STAS domain-containing protein [Solirubrobacteraceae bacterium]
MLASQTGGDAIPESFSVAASETEGEQLIAANGELDIATVPVLEEAFERALEAAPARIVVDLAGVTFIDSTGLRMLIRIAERSADGQLEIRSTPVVDRLLQVTGLLDQLPLVRSGGGTSEPAANS